jgi:hypothetical protein
MTNFMPGSGSTKGYVETKKQNQEADSLHSANNEPRDKEKKNNITGKIIYYERKKKNLNK